MDSKTNYDAIINHLLEVYKGDEYMLQRVDFHMKNMEPMLTMDYQNHTKRIMRTTILENEKAMFVNVFLSKHRFYYLQDSQVGCFYEYDGVHYRVIKEDDIQHKILTNIPQDNTLQDWKYKTKNTIIKQIKTQSLFANTPESSTIQSVLKRLTPAVFPKRDAAKYFLTLIGDNIMKKNKDLIYLVHGKAKHFFTQLDHLAYITIGQSNIMRNLIKYHESHVYSKCRLLNIVDDVEDVFSVDQSLDLFCVACHYSNRFGGADEYLIKKASDEFKHYAFYLKDATKEGIVNKFCENMIINVDEQSTGHSNGAMISWKDIHYLWKTYISNTHLPNMLYSTTLKQILIQKYNYSGLHDAFINITSKHLPRSRSFIDFWEKHVHVAENDELEIDELCHLLKTKGIVLDEKEIVNLICHFFPNVELLNEKYIPNIRCDLWDKPSDIDVSLDQLKHAYKAREDTPFISFEDAYAHYCSTFSSKMIVSKAYFEKYVITTLKDYIEYDKFIAHDWCST